MSVAPGTYWPLFDLRVRTPRIELRYTDDSLGAELAALAARGVHDPAYMPFSHPWTDHASPEIERNALKWYWTCRSTTCPAAWTLPFTVIEGGHVVGATDLIATSFPELREITTGSWLGLAFQGVGIGKEMRAASLHLGFAGLGALFAHTAAWSDNGASLGVTRSLGYRQVGSERRLRRNQATTLRRFRLSAKQWQSGLRRDDIVLEGLEPCLDLLGLA